ncbi:hypothetical protein [Bradyrhizobium sp. ORS 111]|uniref:hypothetical protein n=1 Tax=Bradyrhizobium sp. ORS 111 TaxID=1685958 RepID=UPI00388F08D7
MKQPSDYGTKSALSLQALIADLNWRIQLLSSDIAEEEQRSRVRDETSCTYPTLAKHLRERRAKLLSTVATLEARLRATMPAGSAAA